MGELERGPLDALKCSLKANRLVIRICLSSAEQRYRFHSYIKNPESGNWEYGGWVTELMANKKPDYRVLDAVRQAYPKYQVESGEVLRFYSWVVPDLN